MNSPHAGHGRATTRCPQQLRVAEARTLVRRGSSPQAYVPDSFSIAERFLLINQIDSDGRPPCPRPSARLGQLSPFGTVTTMRYRFLDRREKLQAGNGFHTPRPATGSPCQKCQPVDRPNDFSGETSSRIRAISNKVFTSTLVCGCGCRLATRDKAERSAVARGAAGALNVHDLIACIVSEVSGGLLPSIIRFPLHQPPSIRYPISPKDTSDVLVTPFEVLSVYGRRRSAQASAKARSRRGAGAPQLSQGRAQTLPKARPTASAGANNGRKLYEMNRHLT
ncbi:hypothetical protein EVAR_56756_1 [Eumeta japonica]|uniref:Uncharacterized protein n=1 Tax=Eumeta variegata TaxID=151549 RepID=A0A4C1XQ78_EUMVA|nr:hypothetical protein EVAR_56756_1 [Eumeta japonica]